MILRFVSFVTNVSSKSIITNVLEKLVAKDRELISDNLLTELKDIIIQRDELTKDKFHKLIEKAKVLDIEGAVKAEDFFRDISRILGEELNLEPKELFEKFVEREKESSTVIRKGLAIPHIIVEGKVDGHFYASEMILLCQSADVQGEIIAPRVILEDGCTFNGRIEVDAAATSAAMARARSNITDAISG